MISAFRKFFSTDLSIDLGTANTVIFLRGVGIVLDEPSVVAVRRQVGHQGKTLMQAAGHEAKAMLGRTPQNVEVIRPLKDGVIADFSVTEIMLRHFIKRAYPKRLMNRNLRVIVSVPCVSTQVERRTIRESALSSGASQVYLIEEPMAAAIGANLPVSEASGSMVVDIGGGTTEIGVISLGGIAYKNSVRIGGDKFDEAIIKYLRRHRGILIGEPTAEYIKKAIGSALVDGETQEIMVRGHNVSEGMPRSVMVSSHEIFEAIAEPINGIVSAVRMALERTPPELGSDIVERGMMLTGGGALLKNLDRLLAQETGLPVFVAEDPLTCVARGCGMALDMMDGSRRMLLLE